MPSDYELAEQEKVASVIYIIAAIITIISANRTQQMELEKQISGGVSSNIPPVNPPPTPTQLALLISWIYAIGNIIFGKIAYSRLRKVQEGILSGTETGSAIPNVYITFGWALGIIGSLFRVAGAQLRLEQQQPITIL